MEENKEKRKILVTGSGGMLGTELCAAFSDDYEIAGLDIVQKTEDRRQKTDFVKCDIADKKFTRKTIIELKPDIIIHAAAWTDVDGCERNAEKAKKINETGTENVAQAAGETGALLVYMSTDFIFDGNKKTPYVEDDLSAPLGVYAATKLAGEKIVKKLKKSIIIRTSWLYGKNGKSFVETILEKAKKETTLKVVDDQVGSPTYTMDLAVGIRKLLDIMLRRTKGEGRGTKEIFHISNKGEVSRFDYAKE
ncbi:MAG: dTDP-4-dehydrorhamnose reductase, partial [Candidatus Omnitrophica bacterium]|nr:dTDP-4-dehydrorhamnose reductase [Candidatus Omnitrophota bacterium]